MWTIHVKRMKKKVKTIPMMMNFPVFSDAMRFLQKFQSAQTSKNSNSTRQNIGEVYLIQSKKHVSKVPHSHSCFFLSFLAIFCEFRKICGGEAEQTSNFDWADQNTYETCLIEIRKKIPNFLITNVVFRDFYSCPFPSIFCDFCKICRWCSSYLRFEFSSLEYERNIILIKTKTNFEFILRLLT